MCVTLTEYVLSTKYELCVKIAKLSQFLHSRHRMPI